MDNKRMHDAMTRMTVTPKDREPRWPAVVATLAVGGLYLALPKYLVVGPRWLLGTIIAVLLLPTMVAHRRGHHNLNQIFGYVVLGIVTANMIWSLGVLIHALPHNKEPPIRLLESATALWVTNILIFANWYWRLDAGGPNNRDLRGCHTDGAFLFPQMTMSWDTRKEMGEEDWSPGFVDYLFLAFNFSTALSPADTSVLSRWAKLLVMIQATISLTVIALLAARAVNILTS